MNEAIHQILVGIGSLILAPANALPHQGMRITLPPQDSASAIAHDFSAVSRVLDSEIKKNEQGEQLTLDV